MQDSLDVKKTQPSQTLTAPCLTCRRQLKFNVEPTPFGILFISTARSQQMHKEEPGGTALVRLRFQPCEHRRHNEENRTAVRCVAAHEARRH